MITYMQYSRSMVMVLVKTIYLRLRTKSIEGAGTDGNIYLGIGGREFSVDSANEDFDDFEAGSIRTYIFGEMPMPTNLPGLQWDTARYPEYNDPREPYPLETDDLDKFPVYIRFEPDDDDDDWCLEAVSARVNPLTETTQVKRYHALQGQEQFLWLGHARGKFLFLLEDVPGPLGHTKLEH
jgi:hypothetical protein